MRAYMIIAAAFLSLPALTDLAIDYKYSQPTTDMHGNSRDDVNAFYAKVEAEYAKPKPVAEMTANEQVVYLYGDDGEAI